jgi:hypothetical protein
MNSKRHQELLLHTQKTDCVLFECETCHKKYATKTILTRHKKSCTRLVSPPSSTPPTTDPTNTVVITLETFNQLTTELKEIKTLLATREPSTTLNTTNNITNNINIYLNYLNTHCKDALNMNQFIDNLKFDKEDFKILDKNRFYVQGANKILQNKMELLPIEKRPLRCIMNMVQSEGINQPVPLLVHDNDEWKPECPAVVEYWLNYSNFETEEEKMVVMRLIERYNEKLYDTYQEMLTNDKTMKRMDDKLSISGQSKTHIQMLRELSEMVPLHLDANETIPPLTMQTT